jgi:2-polyprenyl-3-methyl-5-hydroxy-6-metoxy-1,4-benzoquinol methylase
MDFIFYCSSSFGDSFSEASDPDMGKKTLNGQIVDITEIDWNTLIKKMKGDQPGSSHKGSDSTFWNKRAPSFADHASKTFYPHAFIQIMAPKPSWTVLDMGCGGGTLAIPLAGMVKRITAVDFSDKMLEILIAESCKRGITNIDIVKSSWEDDWTECGIGTYDVAIASRSLAVNDVRAAVTKLSNAARRRVLISTIVGDGPFDRKVFEAVGRELSPGVDYVYYYNLLFQMGIHANISFIQENKPKRYGSVEEAFDSMRWMLQETTSEEEARFHRHLKHHLVKQNGQWALDYKCRCRWAVMWWDKDNPVF